jgi:hypothetical protein
MKSQRVEEKNLARIAGVIAIPDDACGVSGMRINIKAC